MTGTRIKYEVFVKDIRDHTSDVRELILETKNPPEFHFKAGQFVMLHVPNGEKPALRAYSIASDDRIKTGFKLLFKYVENGIASRFVWDLKGGETLFFTGPFGRVFFKEPPSQQIVFLNTGTGLSQHLCYLLSKGEQYPHVRYRLYFGVRNEECIYFEQELKELQSKLSDFNFDYVLSRPSENWQGKKGYVQDFINETEYLKVPTTFYLCGNGAMIKDVKARLEAQGFDKALILSEAFD